VLYLDLHRNRRITVPIWQKSIDIFSLCIILDDTMIYWLSAASGSLVMSSLSYQEESTEQVMSLINCETICLTFKKIWAHF